MDERVEKLRQELRRGSLVLAVLAALSTRHYGYSLRRKLHDLGLELDEGTLYPLVRRLAEQGLLDSEWEQADGRERRYYRISAQGSLVLTQLQTEWQQLQQSVQQLLEEASCN